MVCCRYPRTISKIKLTSYLDDKLLPLNVNPKGSETTSCFLRAVGQPAWLQYTNAEPYRHDGYGTVCLVRGLHFGDRIFAQNPGHPAARLAETAKPGSIPRHTTKPPRSCHRVCYHHRSAFAVRMFVHPHKSNSPSDCCISGSNLGNCYH